jgi:hypothetical protein
MAKSAVTTLPQFGLTTATFVAATVSVVVSQLTLVFFVYASHVFAPVHLAKRCSQQLL